MQIPTTYQEAIERKYPESIELAIAKDEHGNYNPITLGWVMSTSIDPPMIAISIGLSRYSLEAIRSAKQFVVTFPSSEQEDDVMFFGTKSGRDFNKIAECNTKTQPATVIDSVLLSDAVANLECDLVSETTTGDHVIFVGEIVASHVNENADLKRIFTLGNQQGMGAVVPG